MTADILADLLQRWAYWVSAGNRAGLGYAMAGYKERIGTSWSTDSTPPPVDPDVLRLDDAINKLPADHKVVMIWHYTQPGTAKAKRAKLDLSRERYYELLDHGRAFVAHLMDETISAQHSGATSQQMLG
jgi:hypothetical protein